MSDIIIEEKNLKDITQTNFQSVGPYTNSNETQVKEPWQGRYKLSGSEDTDFWLNKKRYDGTIVANSGFGNKCKVEVISRTDLLTARGFRV